ncbi:PREDICTED: collagen alpha-1(III) chain-like [Elephantulus edwardii]|uniref:collagen alpha-1(III) chain-like n=1 Tax=Elephantulus edwardii TaxID=28737 RepID=UPI0003F074F0|nr:PREDICTED: collagen alpha-1(III) chain-like [Elephantulus edwardii]
MFAGPPGGLPPPGEEQPGGSCAGFQLPATERRAGGSTAARQFRFPAGPGQRLRAAGEPAGRGGGREALCRGGVTFPGTRGSGHVGASPRPHVSPTRGRAPSGSPSTSRPGLVFLPPGSWPCSRRVRSPPPPGVPCGLRAGTERGEAAARMNGDAWPPAEGSGLSVQSGGPGVGVASRITLSGPGHRGSRRWHSAFLQRQLCSCRRVENVASSAAPT